MAGNIRSIKARKATRALAAGSDRRPAGFFGTQGLVRRKSSDGTQLREGARDDARRGPGRTRRSSPSLGTSHRLPGSAVRVVEENLEAFLFAVVLRSSSVILVEAFEIPTDPCEHLLGCTHGRSAQLRVRTTHRAPEQLRDGRSPSLQAVVLYDGAVQPSCSGSSTGRRSAVPAIDCGACGTSFTGLGGGYALRGTLLDARCRICQHIAKATGD